ncbi:MAG: cell division protein ZipA [Legionellales bacterium]|nr:cell division protein ZipA [Legionellales bacterium]
MLANWSLVLNVLLLMGVVIAIGRMMKERSQNTQVPNYQPPIGPVGVPHHDDIIAVRKINREESAVPPVAQSPSFPTFRPGLKSFKKFNDNGGVHSFNQNPVEKKSAALGASESSLVMFLLAKENRQLAGYELLQTVLAAGLRFGDGHLFHRHQSPNGQGPVLCSLAAATASGVFDMQNIGAFSVRGLCLFMHASGNLTIDAERFAIMLDTAKQLSEGLDTYLLDEKRQPLTDASIQNYHRKLSLVDALDVV